MQKLGVYVSCEVTREKLTMNEPVIHCVLSWHTEINIAGHPCTMQLTHQQVVLIFEALSVGGEATTQS